jgi:GNAT superfamily N-acetyltransferase
LQSTGLPSKPAVAVKQTTLPRPALPANQLVGVAVQHKKLATPKPAESQYRLTPAIWIAPGRQRIRASLTGSPLPIGSVDVQFNRTGKAFISDLEVAMGHRQRGVGTMLMNAAMDNARRQGSTSTELEAMPGPGSISNQALLGMYHKLGFKPLGTTGRGNPLMGHGRVGTNSTHIQRREATGMMGSIRQAMFSTLRRVSSVGTIQRMRTAETVKAEIQQREQKKQKMADFAKTYAHLYGKPKRTAELRMVNSLSFGGNRSSAAVITSGSGDTVYVSEQQGGASKNPDEVWNLSGAEVVATDCEHGAGLHAEMQTIVSLLREWQESGHEYARFGIKSAEAFVRDRIGGGKAAAKGKGCCQLCAAILLKLGVNVAYIEPSQYEKTWQDPFEWAGFQNPWF